MKAIRLLKTAVSLYDEPGNELAASVRPQGGFGGGAEWMRVAMVLMRGVPLPAISPAYFHAIGFVKYGLACAALCFTWLGLLVGIPWWVLAPTSVLAFYAVEVQFVFLFPLAIDGSRRPWQEARRMTANIGTLDAMGVVMPLAVVMLAGGFLGQGFVRCWCLGCLAVTLWYEEEKASHRSLRVRFERVRGQEAVRLLWVTDLHLSARNVLDLGARLCRTARQLRPELIVLGGDVVETNGALPTLRRVLGILSRIAPTHVLPGNHDRRAGLTEFRNVVESSSAFWHEAPGFSLGPEDPSSARDLSFAPATEGHLIFVHDPADLDGLGSNWAVAFAGHLHGGQAVFWRRGELEYPGAWLSRWNGPRFETARGPVIVSRGVADTLPLRWNCPKEIILCEIC